MSKNIDADLLNAALLGLKLRRQTLERRIAELRRTISERMAEAPRARRVLQPVAAPARRARGAQAKAAAAPGPKRLPKDSAAENPPVASAFENRAGRYELVRVADGQAYYSFTNRQGRNVDAVMPVTVWRRMQERAGRE